MAKKSKKRTDEGPGIYEICVDGSFAEYRSALNKADAVQGYLRDHPEDAGKKVEARKARPHPPGTSVNIEGLIKEMTHLRVLQGKLKRGEDITSQEQGAQAGTLLILSDAPASLPGWERSVSGGREVLPTGSDGVRWVDRRAKPFDGLVVALAVGVVCSSEASVRSMTN